MPKPTRAELSERERQVISLISKGLTNREIGRCLHITPSTVEQHITSALRITGARNRRGLAAWVIDQNNYRWSGIGDAYERLGKLFSRCVGRNRAQPSRSPDGQPVLKVSVPYMEIQRGGSAGAYWYIVALYNGRPRPRIEQGTALDRDTALMLDSALKANDA